MGNGLRARSIRSPNLYSYDAELTAGVTGMPDLAFGDCSGPEPRTTAPTKFRYAGSSPAAQAPRGGRRGGFDLDVEC